MHKFRSTLNLLLFVFCFAAFASVADAQATRTWVSGVGDDVNPCSRTAPCKTFAGAISKTATNGEINCLDPGGFGAVTITKSIMIDCTGTLAGILTNTGHGIIVNITNPADPNNTVTLRGLDFNGLGGAANGIRILSDHANVLVENSTIQGFTQHGISVETSGGLTRLSVNNCEIRNNNGNGINTFIVGGLAKVTVSNSRLVTNTTGFNLSNNSKGTLANSSVSGNTTGLSAFQADMAVTGSEITNNTTGISASTGATFRLTRSAVTGNTTGLSPGSGSIISYSSNVFTGNTTDGAPTSTVAQQ